MKKDYNIKLNKLKLNGLSVTYKLSQFLGKYEFWSTTGTAIQFLLIATHIAFCVAVTATQFS